MTASATSHTEQPDKCDPVILKHLQEKQGRMFTFAELLDLVPSTNTHAQRIRLDRALNRLAGEKGITATKPKPRASLDHWRIRWDHPPEHDEEKVRDFMNGHRHWRPTLEETAIAMRTTPEKIQGLYYKYAADWKPPPGDPMFP